ncbi:MAG: hypothetical protein DMF61_14835 [Blastocatellia bacterium AA13]|nr:MAG: hypothetical protein DMF61_14835 [Blastocatellia bacterium AA13]
MEAGASEGKYEETLRKLIKFFDWKRCDDPESMALETLSRFLSTIASEDDETGKDTPLVLYSIANNVFREYLRKASHLASSAFALQIETPDIFAGCVKVCLEKLSDEDRNLLKAYYSVDERILLAESLGVDLAVLRMRVHRILTQVQSCYRKCIENEMRK